jgi:uncharacterized protein
MAHPNEELLRRGYEAFAAGDIDTVLGVFAPDIKWHVGGENQLSGDYTGHEEVVAFFSKLFEVTGGTLRLELHEVLVNDAHGAVLVTQIAEREGQTLHGREVHWWNIADGKATEFWNLAENGAKVDRFFG